MSIGYHVRKASMLDAPEWLAITERAAKLDPYVSLLDICICIPRLLERTDKLGSSTDSSSTTTTFSQSLDQLLNDASQLARRGFDWFAAFEAGGTPRYKKVAVTQMAGFVDIILDKDDDDDHHHHGTFDPVFDFDTFGAGICYMIYWMSMLILQSNSFKLLRQHRRLAPKELSLWDRELSGYADSICRSVPYHCRPAAGYTAKFGSLTPLMVARKYFEAKQAEREQRWCAAVAQGARVPGLYSAQAPLEPMRAVRKMVQKSDRYL